MSAATEQAIAQIVKRADEKKLTSADLEELAVVAVQAMQDEHPLLRRFLACRIAPNSWSTVNGDPAADDVMKVVADMRRAMSAPA